MQLVLSMRRLFDARLQQACGMSIREYEVLVRLWLAPDNRLTPQQLVDAVITTPGDIATRVAELELKGLVHRSTDTREATVELTPFGKRRFAAAERVESESVRVCFTDLLTDPEARTLTRLAERLRDISLLDYHDNFGEGSKVGGKPYHKPWP